jgi:hypothetical protein
MTASQNEITPNLAFYLMLDSACKAFRTLQALLANEIALVRRKSGKSEGQAYDHLLVQALPACTDALALSFIFNGRRANRLCEKHAADLRLERDERRRFMHATAALTLIRDVREHLLDGKDGRTPTEYDRVDNRGDELALTYDGPTGRILVGPVNLCAVYPSVKRALSLVEASTPELGP